MEIIHPLDYPVPSPGPSLGSGTGPQGGRLIFTDVLTNNYVGFVWFINFIGVNTIYQFVGF